MTTLRQRIEALPRHSFYLDGLANKESTETSYGDWLSREDVLRAVTTSNQRGTMFDKEPAVLIAAIAAIIQGVVIFTTGDPGATAPEWIMALVTMLVGVLVRTQVFSRNTIKEADTLMELKKAA